jgi:hypothetical protein
MKILPPRHQGTKEHQEKSFFYINSLDVTLCLLLCCVLLAMAVLHDALGGMPTPGENENRCCHEKAHQVRSFL